jgi:hypothetical protein
MFASIVTTPTLRARLTRVPSTSARTSPAASVRHRTARRRGPSYTATSIPFRETKVLTSADDGTANLGRTEEEDGDVGVVVCGGVGSDDDGSDEVAA